MCDVQWGSTWWILRQISIINYINNGLIAINIATVPILHSLEYWKSVRGKSIVLLLVQLIFRVDLQGSLNCLSASKGFADAGGTSDPSTMSIVLDTPWIRYHRFHANFNNFGVSLANEKADIYPSRYALFIFQSGVGIRQIPSWLRFSTFKNEST